MLSDGASRILPLLVLNLLALLWFCRCRQLHMILPDFLPKYWLKVVSQPWEGDVTMVLPSLVWQIKKAISNPTPSELHKAVQVVSTASPCCDWVSSDENLSRHKLVCLLGNQHHHCASCMSSERCALADTNLPSDRSLSEALLTDRKAFRMHPAAG